MNWQALIGITFFVSTTVGCTGNETTHAEKRLRSSSSSQPVTITLTGDNVFHVEVHNLTTRSFIFWPMPGVGISVFHESENGVITNLTDYASKAEIVPTSPFDTVHLMPGASYNLKLKVFVLKEFGIDRSLKLKEKGNIYAVVDPLTVEDFDKRYQLTAKNKPLLKVELRSSSISVPAIR